ncbi:NAD(P)-dependent glycerol-3-phosphate dehydrogenase [bacterium]|nr:NAD(P)-dependent glycerol-3-phosphate dehydrogenase [bacterium]
MALKITTIGSGSWGTALANVFADAGSDVLLWGRDSKVVQAINDRRENPKYLSGVTLSARLSATADLAQALDAAEVVVCSVPTQQIRAVFGPHRSRLKGKLVINTAKGFEVGSHKRVSEIFAEIAPEARYSVLSGPSFAAEVAARQPTAVTVAAADAKVAEQVQRLVSTAYFRAYTSTDVAGVEVAGALKNVVALAAGIVRGSKLGFNAQAAVINRGLAEMVRAGKSLGAEPTTFLGLSGVGDLVLTCTGPLSRNLRLGILLGEGRLLQDAIQTLGGVAEGVYTAQSAADLARARKIEMPILFEIHSILYQGKTPQNAIAFLMGRDLREENS